MRFRIFKWILILVIVIFFVSLIPVKYPFFNKNNRACPFQIWVLSNGYHTSFIFKSRDVQDLVSLFPQKKSTYIEIAWGDSAFYTTPGFTWSLGIKAMLTKTNTVMHVVHFNDPPESYFYKAQMKRLVVCGNNLAALEKFIIQSFERDKNGNLKYIKEGLYGDSEFYEANGHYSFFYNCNNWIQEGLNEAGYATPMWAGYPYAIFLYL